MTKEQEEAIEYLRKLHPKIYWIKPNGPLLEEDKVLKKAIETVLNMLKEKDAEIEKYKKLLADNLAKELNNSIKAKEKADADLDDLDKGWKIELEKKDKMIDLFIDELVTNMFDRCCQECCRECEKDRDTLRSCIKQYFERKLENARN